MVVGHYHLRAELVNLGASWSAELVHLVIHLEKDLLLPWASSAAVKHFVEDLVEDPVVDLPPTHTTHSVRNPTNNSEVRSKPDCLFLTKLILSYMTPQDSTKPFILTPSAKSPIFEGSRYASSMRYMIRAHETHDGMKTTFSIQLCLTLCMSSIITPTALNCRPHR